MDDVTSLLDRVAELTRRLALAEFAMGADGPITGDALPEAIVAVIAERDRLRGELEGFRRTFGADLMRRLNVVVAERDRLQESENEYDQLITRQGALLTGVANVLKGEPGPLTLHDWSDLPTAAAATVAERDRLREKLESWAGDGAEYRHALDHVVDCTEGCDQCIVLARATLDRTTMGKAREGT